MNFIYPLDYLCDEVDFSEITNFKDMRILLNTLQDNNIKKYIDNFNKESDSFVMLECKNAEEILCKDNIITSKSSDWFYDNIFFDICKINDNITFKPKIIYSVCERCKEKNKDDLIVTVHNLAVLKVKYISLSTLLQIIKKYDSVFTENNTTSIKQDSEFKKRNQDIQSSDSNSHVFSEFYTNLNEELLEIFKYYEEESTYKFKANKFAEKILELELNERKLFIENNIEIIMEINIIMHGLLEQDLNISLDNININQLILSRIGNIKFYTLEMILLFLFKNNYDARDDEVDIVNNNLWKNSNKEEAYITQNYLIVYSALKLNNYEDINYIFDSSNRGIIDTLSSIYVIEYMHKFNNEYIYVGTKLNNIKALANNILEHEKYKAYLGIFLNKLTKYGIRNYIVKNDQKKVFLNKEQVFLRSEFIQDQRFIEIINKLFN
jgi:hypothetical protein